MNLNLSKLWLLITAIIICTFIMQSSVLANALGVPDTEYDALVALYTSTGGSGWTHKTNWLTGNTPWYGITVEGGHVTSIDLYNNNLTGQIPTELGSLTNLLYICLAGNHLNGEIPPAIGNLTNLQDLILYSNQLTGAIPAELGNLVNLRELNLSNNQLTDAIPSEIGNMTNLIDMSFYGNQLSGTIPAELGNLVNLKWLDFANNQLTGTMPAELSNMTNLESLGLYNNQLTGSIPPEIGNMTSLGSLVLYGNQLSGIIPSEVGNMTNLRELDLGDNQLTGTIPVELCNLANLHGLLLFRNQLTGTIPAEIGKLTNLDGLNFGDNQLSGSIPTELGNLTKLRSLSLGHNRLTGSIPAEMGNMVNLQWLDLGWNQLTGAIPDEICNHLHLNYLYLHSNRLTGDVPVSITNLKGLYGADLGYNALTSSNPAVLSFLAGKDPDWRNTQTVPPTDITATVLSNGDVLVFWTPILYIHDIGYYEVGYSSTPGGPYTFDTANRTSDKHASSLTVNGLDLTDPVYFVVRTVSLAGEGNQSTLTSQLSTEAEGNNVLGISYSDYDALIAMYNSTDGDNWTNNTNWLTENIPWHGVTIEGGHVTSISLYENNLTGQIPVELGNLTNLHELYLYSNHLSGTIPTELANLANLQYLHLGDNQLTGTIPVELGNMTSLQWLHLGVNQLTGTIPAEIGNLTNLQLISLSGNHLTGVIPAELGSLTNLTYLRLDYNQLSGTIPPEIGNLTNLQWLKLGWNQLTGAIPAELGDLTNLYYLELSWNQLSGTMPAELVNLPDLGYLLLSSNQLAGDLPPSITNLTDLLVADLGYNALTSSDPTVLSFLAGKDPDWQSSQTVPPTDISVIQLLNGKATVSWTHISYRDDSGYYEVGYSSTPGGPYTFAPSNRTSSKYASSLTVNGIDFYNPVYFVIRTVSLASSHNQSALTSQLSLDVIPLPSAQDKLGVDGSLIALQNMFVTALFPDCFYIEKQDRTWGIRVDGSFDYLEKNTSIDIVGKLHTNIDGERYIEIEDMDTLPPLGISMNPLYLTNRTLGGFDWFYNSEFGAGQRGVDGCHGLNNIGLLVKTCGTVTFAGRDWLYIDDGSGLDDGSGIKGLYVDASGYPSIAEGSFVWVTGISSCDLYQGRIVNTLLAIDGGIITGGNQPMSIGGEGPVNPRKH